MQHTDDLRTLDAEIAEKVMGLAQEDIYRRTMVRSDLPHYSTDIAAAWKVVERLVALGYPTVTVTASAPHKGYIACVWRREDDPFYESGRYVECCIEDGLPAPLAICRAALKTVGED